MAAVIGVLAVETPGVAGGINRIVCKEACVEDIVFIESLKTLIPSAEFAENIRMGNKLGGAGLKALITEPVLQHLKRGNQSVCRKTPQI